MIRFKMTVSPTDIIKLLNSNILKHRTLICVLRMLNPKQGRKVNETKYCLNYECTFNNGNFPKQKTGFLLRKSNAKLLNPEP